jgi:hypothetical protein
MATRARKGNRRTWQREGPHRRRHGPSETARYQPYFAFGTEPSVVMRNWISLLTIGT